jgi:hypothetical protein
MAKQTISTTPTSKVEPNLENTNKTNLPFDKSNYQILLIGLVVLMTGFFIMTLDKEEFGFGFLGLTLGPIITFIGFLIPFYAIFKKKKQ